MLTFSYKFLILKLITIFCRNFQNVLEHDHDPMITENVEIPDDQLFTSLFDFELDNNYLDY